MKNLLAVAGLGALLFLTAPPLRAQTGGVEGKVVDEEGKPLPDATVVVQSLRVSLKSEVKTDKKGRYRMIGLQSGPYRVTAARDGYQARYVETNVHLGDATQVMDIQLVSLAAIEKVTGPSENDLRERFNGAIEQIRAGHLDEAEATFVELVALKPDVVEFQQNLGYVRAKKKDWKGAEESYEAALALKPGDVDLSLALAGAYEGGGEPDRSLEILGAAAAAHPENGTLQYERGILYLKATQPEQATEALLAALQRDPSLADAHYFLGTLMVNQGKVDEAVEHFEAYLASDPKNEKFADTAKGMLAALKKQ